MIEKRKDQRNPRSSASHKNRENQRNQRVSEATSASHQKGVFAGRVGVQQRVLPAYRAGFFDALAEACQGGLSVFAGEPRPDESIAVSSGLSQARYAPARNRHFLRVSSPLFLLWQDNILGWLESWDPDVLILEANPRYLSSWLAVRWMHVKSRPVIGWGLGAPPGNPTSLIGKFQVAFQKGLRRGFLLSCDALIAYSRRGADQYHAEGFPADRIFIAPNAVALRPTEPPPERSPDYGQRPTVLFVGRLQKRKRIDLLLRACAALPEAQQPRLWLIGEGPAKAEFQSLAESIYPLAEFPGARHGEALKPYFLSADLFVLPGTGGLAVQEAMAHGLPVIVAEGDGTQEDLVRPENGWSIPSDDLLALQEALHKALSNPARLRRMGRESFRLVSEEINLEAMVNVFLHALQTVTPAEKLLALRKSHK